MQQQRLKLLKLFFTAETAIDNLTDQILWLSEKGQTTPDDELTDKVIEACNNLLDLKQIITNKLFPNP